MPKKQWYEISKSDESYIEPHVFIENVQQILKQKGYQVIDTIDSGSFGIVYKIKYNNEEYAVKGVKVFQNNLKARNILISNDEVCKISDFGTSIRVVGDRKVVGKVGTPAYISPEQLNEKECDFKTDIYPMGCICMEFLTEFADLNELKEALIN